MSVITIGAATHKGQRKDENQDHHRYFPPQEGRHHKMGTLIALADGMGGHAGGATASKLAVETLFDTYYNSPRSTILEALNAGYTAANTAVYEKSETDPALSGMGCTLTSVVVKGDKFFFAHVGDSRGYSITNDEIKAFTEDHSFVAGLVKAGVIKPEEAKDHPDGNIITRAIGLQPEVQVDAGEAPHSLQKGQYLLICCDGLWGVVRDDVIRDTVRQLGEPDAICQELVNIANQNGGPDNITVLVARIDKTGLLSRIL